MITKDDIQQAEQEQTGKVYFLRVNGNNHAGVKDLAKKLGISMERLSDMIVEQGIRKIQEEGTVSIKVSRAADGSTDMKIN